MTYREVLEEKCRLGMSHIMIFLHVSTIHRDTCLAQFFYHCSHATHSMLSSVLICFAVYSKALLPGRTDVPVCRNE